MPQEVRLTIFIIVAIFAGLGFFAWFFYRPLKRHLWRHHPEKFFYGKVMRVTRDNDFYLLNNLVIDSGTAQEVKIDHLIGGNRFLFVISDRYYDGALNAQADEPTWIQYPKRNKKIAIPNPLLENRYAISRLSVTSGISSSYMIGIVLINNDCFVTPFELEPTASLLVPLSKLEKVVESYENQANVPPFRAKELWQTIQDLHELGEQNRAGKD
jgi:hypothetical protein